jgi:type IV pilus assembly protein PilN
MLDALATMIPPKVWITSIDEKNNNLTIKGSAITNEDVADFMREMKKSPFFKEPSLKKTVQKDDTKTGVKYVEFELTSGVSYSA